MSKIMRLPTRLLSRKADSHKGTYGSIVVVAGSRRYSGAAVLCATAALRSGAGMVTLGIPASITNAVIKIKPPEIITLPLPQTTEGSLSPAGIRILQRELRESDVVALGPGLSRLRPTVGFVRSWLPKIPTDLVIDADGLNALAGRTSLLNKRADRGKETIVTPHPGEMAGLTGIPTAEIAKKRTEIARTFAFEHRVTVVLKGNKTVVADKDGRCYTNHTGNPGMATAGTGDVLTGIIAAFLGQGLDGFEAAKYGVYLHGLAGDLAAEEKTQICLIASDIIDKIPKAVRLSSS